MKIIEQLRRNDAFYHDFGSEWRDGYCTKKKDLANMVRGYIKKGLSSRDLKNTKIYRFTSDQGQKVWGLCEADKSGVCDNLLYYFLKSEYFFY